MARNPKHRYSEAEEKLIWSHYTPEEKETHNNHILGYWDYPANKRLIDSIRNDAIARKEQNDGV